MQERVLFNIHLQKSESKQNIGCQYLRFGSHLSELGSDRSTCVRTKLTVLQKDITSRPFPQILRTKESLSFTYTANGKRQIQVENLKIDHKQIKTAQNNSYG